MCAEIRALLAITSLILFRCLLLYLFSESLYSSERGDEYNGCCLEPVTDEGEEDEDEEELEQNNVS